MSKRKDRARAESGLIFRDGNLVRKEEWYAAHPTREMLAERQAGVDKAVAEVMEAKKQAEEAGERKVIVTTDHEAAGAPPFDYYCSKCKHDHKFGSKVHEQHQGHAEPIDNHS